MSEVSDFLKDLNPENQPESVLEKPLEVPAETPETEKEEGFKAQNRRERRLLSENQRLREETIAAHARAEGERAAREALAKTSEEDDFLKIVEPIYGNSTPQEQAASKILKDGLKAVYERAKADAISEMEGRYESREQSETRAIREEEDNLDSMMERLEDEYDADFSDASTRRGFLTLLEKLSPKDEDGNIIEYADADTAYELYERSKEKATSRAKELSSRSMTQSGASLPTKLEQTALERTLKQIGII